MSDNHASIIEELETPSVSANPTALGNFSIDELLSKYNEFGLTCPYTKMLIENGVASAMRHSYLDIGKMSDFRDDKGAKQFLNLNNGKVNKFPFLPKKWEDLEPTLEDMRTKQLSAIYTKDNPMVLLDNDPGSDESDEIKKFYTEMHSVLEVMNKRGILKGVEVGGEALYNDLKAFVPTSEEEEWIESTITFGMINGKKDYRGGTIVFNTDGIELPNTDGFHAVDCKDPTSFFEILNVKAYFFPTPDSKAKMPCPPNFINKDRKLLPHFIVLKHFLDKKKSKPAAQAKAPAPNNPARNKKAKGRPKNATTPGHNLILLVNEYIDICEEHYKKAKERGECYWADGQVDRMACGDALKEKVATALKLPTIPDRNWNTPQIHENFLFGDYAKFTAQKDRSVNVENGKRLAEFAFNFMTKCYQYDNYPNKDSWKPSDSIFDDDFIKWRRDEYLDIEQFAAWETEVNQAGPKTGQPKYEFSPSLENNTHPYFYHLGSNNIYVVCVDEDSGDSIVYECGNGTVRRNRPGVSMLSESQRNIRDDTLDYVIELDKIDFAKMVLKTRIIHNAYKPEGFTISDGRTTFNTYKRTKNQRVATGEEVVSEPTSPLTCYRLIEHLFSYATVGYTRQDDSSLKDEDYIHLFEENLEQGNPIAYAQVMFIMSKFANPLNSVVPVWCGEKRIGKDSGWVFLLKQIYRGMGSGVVVFQSMQAIFEKHASDVGTAPLIIVNDDKNSPIESAKITERLKSITGSDEVRVNRKYHDPKMVDNMSSIAATTNTPPSYLEGAKRKMEVWMCGGMRNKEIKAINNTPDKTNMEIWIQDSQRLENVSWVRKESAKKQINENNFMTMNGIEAMQENLTNQAPSFLQVMYDKNVKDKGIKSPSFFVNQEPHSIISKKKAASAGAFYSISAAVASIQSSDTQGNRANALNQLVSIINASPDFNSKRYTFLQYFNRVGDMNGLDFSCLLADKITS